MAELAERLTGNAPREHEELFIEFFPVGRLHARRHIILDLHLCQDKVLHKFAVLNRGGLDFREDILQVDETNGIASDNDSV